MMRIIHGLIRCLRIVVLALTVIAAARSADAGPSWYRVVTPHFTIVSDAGEKAATNVALQFEQARAAFQQIWPWAKADTGNPTLVFALSNESDFRALSPLDWSHLGGLTPTPRLGKEPYYDGDLRYSSAFFDGQERRFVVLISDSVLRFEPKRTDVNPHGATYWACASLAINASFPSRLPPWLTRGLAQVMANTIVRDDAVTFGQYVPWSVDQLRFRRLSFEELSGAGWDSKPLKDENWRRTFDASAWALVHYLMLGDSGANLPRFTQAMMDIAGGADVEPSLNEAYGGREKIAQAYTQYARLAAFTYRRVDARIVVAVESFEIQRLTEAESAALLRTVLTAQGRGAESRR